MKMGAKHLKPIGRLVVAFQAWQTRMDFSFQLVAAGVNPTESDQILVKKRIFLATHFPHSRLNCHLIYYDSFGIFQNCGTIDAASVGAVS